MEPFLGALALLLLGCGAVAAVYAVGAAVAVARTPLLVEPFDAGHAAPEHAVSRFHARWYAATLLFLAFDVEMLFMYPWAVVVADVGVTAVVEMFGFLLVLLAGVVYAWREGALRWA